MPGRSSALTVLNRLPYMPDASQNRISSTEVIEHLTSILDTLAEKFQQIIFDLINWWHSTLRTINPSDYIPTLDFGGYLTVLVFSVAVYTLSGPTYRIRISTAILPFNKIFFWVLFLSGVILILLESIVYFSIKVPYFVSPYIINLVVASLLMITIMYWLKVSFLAPPKYGRCTAAKFRQAIFLNILNGSRDEILALAREIMREMHNLIILSPKQIHTPVSGDVMPKYTKLEDTTYDIFLLLADSRFCTIVAEDLPAFPAHMVQAAIELKRPDAPISLITRRIVVAFMSSKRSALHIENEWLSSSYMGTMKPITQEIFYNWHSIEIYNYSGVESPLDLHYPYASEWDVDTWRTYLGISEVYIHGLLEAGKPLAMQSGVRFILQTLEEAFKPIAQFNNVEDQSVRHNIYRTATISGEFVIEIVRLIDKQGAIYSTTYAQGDRLFFYRDNCTYITNLIFSAIKHASQINTKEFDMWMIQHNLVWSLTSDHDVADLQIMKMVRRNLRRLLWNEVKRMDESPNFVGAKVLRFCLNVLGFYTENSQRRDTLDKDSWPLAKVVTNWVRRNYASLVDSHPPVAEACLPATVQYDPIEMALVRYREDTLTGRPRLTRLELERPGPPAR